MEQETLDLYVFGVLERVRALASSTLPPVTADVVYTRISADRYGLEEGVERQEDDSINLAKRHGVSDLTVFKDNDISASPSSKKPRPDFELMLAHIMQGSIKRVFCYSNSRITRRPMELELLILFHQQYKVQFLTCVSGIDDLSTADGRMVARYKAVADAAEAERTSERKTRQHKGRAEKGIKHSGRYRTYGYTKGKTVIAEEAAVVKECFTRKAAGESLTSIASDLNDRNIKTVTGSTWTASNLSKMLSKSEYAGLLTFHGDVVARTAFEPIVSEALFNESQEMLSSTARRGQNARKHLLTGILVCSKCFTTMKGNGTEAKKSYRCPSPKTTQGACGKCSIKMSETDFLIENAAFRYQQWHDEPVYAPKMDYKAEREAIEADKAYVATADLPIADKVRMTKELNTRMAAVLKEEAEDTPPTPFDELLEWDKRSLSRKRAFISKYIANVIVYPPTQGARAGFDNRRLEVHYVDGSVERLTNAMDVYVFRTTFE